jgi:hypothetical protein
MLACHTGIVLAVSAWFFKEKVAQKISLNWASGSEPARPNLVNFLLLFAHKK